MWEKFSGLEGGGGGGRVVVMKGWDGGWGVMMGVGETKWIGNRRVQGGRGGGCDVGDGMSVMMVGRGGG